MFYSKIKYNKAWYIVRDSGKRYISDLKENSFGSFLKKTWSLSLEPCSQDRNLWSSYQQLNPSHDPKASMDVFPPTLLLSLPPAALIFSFHHCFSPLHDASLWAVWSVFLDYICRLKRIQNYSSLLLRLKQVQRLRCMLPNNWSIKHDAS